MGSHMLDPWHLLKAIKPNLVGDEIAKTAKLEEIFNLIVERNPDDFKKEFARLKNDAASKKVMEALEARKERIFYCEVDSSFIGIRRTSC